MLSDWIVSSQMNFTWPKMRSNRCKQTDSWLCLLEYLRYLHFCLTKLIWEKKGRLPKIVNVIFVKMFFYKFFLEQFKRKKLAGIHLHWWLRHIFYIFPKLSRFFYKNLNFPEFSLRFSNFSNSLSFPGFPCFPGLSPPCWYLLIINRLTTSSLNVCCSFRW